jgi:hypothetical protein
MATEPVDTSRNYDPNLPYKAPLGRLPILGKARAEIDKIRSTIADDLNQMQNRSAAQTDSNAKITGEIAALVDKTASETGLLDQKTATELAQTSDIIPVTVGVDSTGSPRSPWNGTTAIGVVGNQRKLFDKQTDGFDRDAEQKLAKIYVDTWSVRATTDTALPAPAGLDDTEIAAVLSKAKTGIDA